MRAPGVLGRAAAVGLAVGLLAAAPPVRAQGFEPPHVEQQKVQLNALAGWGFGGSVRDVALGDERSLKAAAVYGGALDIRAGAGWNAELFYSRQQTQLAGGAVAPFDVTQERYLLGLQEEKGDQKVRWFGTFWLGGTRFIPGGGFDAATKFTGGLGLGIKAFFTNNVGLRLEARGIYTLVKGEGGLACVNGQCLFAFTGNGLLQGDVGGGLILAF